MAHNTIVRHAVKNYEDWRRIYDQNIPNRQDFGLLSTVIYRTSQNPNELFLIQEWENIDKAYEFFGLEELHAKMEEAGVTDEPDVWFLEEVARPSL